jgi:hypothetical protein
MRTLLLLMGVTAWFVCQAGAVPRSPEVTWTQFVAVEGQPEPVPTQWVSTPEGRFAHSLKVPNPVPKDSGYRKGMTSEDYFHHLCNAEAGEFVFRQVQNVQGLAQLRPMGRATDDELRSRYALEHPDAAMYFYGGPPETLFVGLTAFQFFEAAPTDWHKKYGVTGAFLRFSGYDEFKDRGMIATPIDRPQARYGFLWRGVKRPYDRENGIAGGEVIVIDTLNNEVLGLRRAYLRSGGVRKSRTGIWWLTGQMCLAFSDNPRQSPQTELLNFVGRVLQPASRK